VLIKEDNATQEKDFPLITISPLTSIDDWPLPSIDNDDWLIDLPSEMPQMIVIYETGKRASQRSLRFV
jgi:hypothetical protein